MSAMAERTAALAALKPYPRILWISAVAYVAITVASTVVLIFVSRVDLDYEQFRNFWFAYNTTQGLVVSLLVATIEIAYVLTMRRYFRSPLYIVALCGVALRVPTALAASFSTAIYQFIDSSFGLSLVDSAAVPPLLALAVLYQALSAVLVSIPLLILAFLNRTQGFVGYATGILILLNSVYAFAISVASWGEKEVLFAISGIGTIVGFVFAVFSILFPVSLGRSWGPRSRDAPLRRNREPQAPGQPPPAQATDSAPARSS